MINCTINKGAPLKLSHAVEREKQREREIKRMRSQEQPQHVSDVVPSSSSWGGGSNHIAALNLEGTPPPNITDSSGHKQFDHHNEDSQVFLTSVHAFLAMHFSIFMMSADPVSRLSQMDPTPV